MHTAITGTVLGHIEFAVFATGYFLIEVPILLAATMRFQRWRGAASLCQTRSASLPCCQLPY